MTKTVTKEKGKTDKVADNGTVTDAPEGEGNKDTGAYFINGQPATKEEYDKSQA